MRASDKHIPDPRAGRAPRVRAAKPSLTPAKIRSSGFTMIEIMIVVAIIGLLAAIAVPTYLQSRTTAHQNTCINNLRQIESAIQQWATEERKAESTTVALTDISPFLKGGVVCPAGGTSFGDSYSLNTVADAPSCLLSPSTHVWMGSDVVQIARPAPASANENGNGSDNANGNGHGHGHGNGNMHDAGHGHGHGKGNGN